jgi:hypothetical protein
MLRARSKRPAAKRPAAKRPAAKRPDISQMMVSREERLKILTGVIKFASASLATAKREKNASDITFFTEKIETARELYRRIYSLKPHTSWLITQRMP